MGGRPTQQGYRGPGGGGNWQGGGKGGPIDQMSAAMGQMGTGGSPAASPSAPRKSMGLCIIDPTDGTVIENHLLDEPWTNPLLLIENARFAPVTVCI